MSTSIKGNKDPRVLAPCLSIFLRPFCIQSTEYPHVLSMESTMFCPGRRSQPALTYQDASIHLLPTHHLITLSSSQYNFYQFIANNHLTSHSHYSNVPLQSLFATCLRLRSSTLSGHQPPNIRTAIPSWETLSPPLRLLHQTAASPRLHPPQHPNQWNP
jgi:hypothetical protein